MDSGVHIFTRLVCVYEDVFVRIVLPSLEDKDEVYITWKSLSMGLFFRKNSHLGVADCKIYSNDYRIKQVHLLSIVMRWNYWKYTEVREYWRLVIIVVTFSIYPYDDECFERASISRKENHSHEFLLAHTTFMCYKSLELQKCEITIRITVMFKTKR